MTPLVLIPGMMCDARLFAPQIAAFSGNRGLHLAPIAAQDSVPALAAQILASAPPRFALAGLSMGGIVAMEVLRQAPDRVDRIALLDTNPRAESDAVKARRRPQLEAVAQGRLAQVMREEMKPNYLAPGPRRADILDLCLEMALALGPEVFARQSRALMDRPDQCDTLRAARLPALVLCGRADALCPVHRHELMANLIPGARLEIVEQAGHLPTLERPEFVNAALGRWLEAA
ncbi:MAG: alpha/beta fold hydrolase [Marinovum algicola]|jgi:pimeloyl-ACP methyl ester carboxylesterase|uniref:Pimeloyl-ACP methyl ester carboxylesterase n=1 Tax=Marinovum algicola TaxID=42444 RepID=A0A975WDK1_9RHOB|nr:alpha/beta fold hydrolase [Marinovum algicola]SEK01742.1 Pimeloyl-ACP methyl ester carboxylesterase [Marinovum algicola]SLN43858.1 acyl-CoA esterase [Marinovum algicola]